MRIEIAQASAPTEKLGKEARIANAMRKPRKQSGVIPYRVTEEGKLEILLVSSSHSGKWGIPKGGVETDMTKRMSAATEALEEAGLKGKAKKKLGTYTYVKGATGRPQIVDVYAMRVRKQLQNWLERDRRTRKWFSTKKARKHMPSAMWPMVDKLERLISR